MNTRKFIPDLRCYSKYSLGLTLISNDSAPKPYFLCDREIDREPKPKTEYLKKVVRIRLSDHDADRTMDGSDGQNFEETIRTRSAWL